MVPSGRVKRVPKLKNLPPRVDEYGNCTHRSVFGSPTWMPLRGHKFCGPDGEPIILFACQCKALDAIMLKLKGDRVVRKTLQFEEEGANVRDSESV